MDALSKKIILHRKCGCREGFKWKTDATYKAHFKSRRHKLWAETKEKRDVQENCIRIENENGRLKQTMVKLRKHYSAIINTITEAEKEIREAQSEISRAQSRISAKKNRKRSLVRLAEANQKLLASQEKLEKAKDMLKSCQEKTSLNEID